LYFAQFEIERDERPVFRSELSVRRTEFSFTAEDGSTSFVVPEGLKEYLLEAGEAEVVAAFDPRRMVSERGAFPFRDPRKVDQVAPLQLEEELPFDINGFLLEIALEDGDPADEFPALLVAVSSEEIGEQLAFLKQLEIDPAILTPAVIGLGALAASAGEPSASIVAADANRFSFLTVRREAPAFCRDCPTSGEDAALSEILPTLLSARRALGELPQALLCVGRKLRLPIEGIRSELLTFERVGDLDPVSGRPAPSTSIGSQRSLLSLTGLAIARVNRKPIPNFRKGQFRYHGNFRQMLAPLWEERRYGGLLLLCLFFWLGTSLYASASKRSLLDERIHSAVQKSFPAEIVPEGGELAFVQSRVAVLEERLKGLGSVSSLSPLEGFREISQVIGPNVDVAIDTVSISPASITFGGTVADTGTVGRVIGLLEKRGDRFCSVKVEPRGNVPGGSRVRIIAELKYCQ